MLTVVSTSGFAERFVSQLINSGYYRRHIRRLRGRIDVATATAVENLATAGWPVAMPPGGGPYLWVPFPEGLDEAGLCHRASAQEIFLAPGSIFFPDQIRNSHPAVMRVNVAYANDPRFLSFLNPI